MTLNPAARTTGNGTVWRVSQFLRAVVHRHDPETDRRLRAILKNDKQWELIARLSTFDRAHHLKVHDTLRGAGYEDRDLLLAAVLHDAGKADGRCRVGVVHRVLKVLLNAVSPRLLNRAAREDSGWIGHGLYLAMHHPGLGAELARATGASERCAALIARHEDSLPVDDPLLSVLIQADAGSIT